MHYHSNLVPLREAFEHIGECQFPDEWTGDEAAATLPGRRSLVGLDAWKRACRARSIMISMIDNEQLGIVIDMPGLRVRYGATATPRITNMYLSPTNDADAGFVELEDQDIYFARADMRALPKPNSRAKARPGPKKSFDHVFAVCVDYFRQFGFTQSNSEVRAALEAMRPEIEPLPKKTRERELINEARDLVRNEPIAIRNSDLTATDAL